MPRDVYIQTYAAACALGADRNRIKERLFAAAPTPVSGSATLVDGQTVPVGALPFEPAATGDTLLDRSRTNRLLAHTLTPLRGDILHAVEHHQARRVGIVLGTSTSGVGETGDAIAARHGSSVPVSGVDLLEQQELYDPVRAARTIIPATGPAYCISTACTSGVKALIAAARLIRADLCDAVVCGGVDTICDLTLNGFAALEAISSEVSQPFSINRRGINIGEAAAIFLLTAEPGPFRLMGWGESSDAYHISSPDPNGEGAVLAVNAALTSAHVSANDIDYVHLHGTGTQLNDAMEAGVINRIFGPHVPCSSTKPLTGHTLGAAGALQTAFCLMALETGMLPPHVWDKAADPALAPLNLIPPGSRNAALRRTLSTSFAFGGNNAAVVLASA